MASHAEMTASNMLRLQGFPSNMVCTQLNCPLDMLLFSACNHSHVLLFLYQGKQRSSFKSTRHTPSRRSRVVRHCLNLRHLCRLPNQRAIVPNIRTMPPLTAAVSRGVNSPLIEASVDDMELVSRIIHFYRKPLLQESGAQE